MNFMNWRTDAELMEIITNDRLDYDIRIQAAKERICRSGPPCSTPGCKNRSSSTWATIPVCRQCRDILLAEQVDYYKQKIKASDRTVIYMIGPKLPWRPITTSNVEVERDGTGESRVSV